ncbi:MAG TPA: hypothetical protein VF791_09955 [Pyrinomonadaceae bacterium]
MSWVTDERRQQEVEEAERARRSRLLADLGSAFFERLRRDVKRDVEEINDVYSDEFDQRSNSHLVFHGDNVDSFTVMCGPNTPLSVTHMPSRVVIKAISWKPTDRYAQFNQETDYYHLKLDRQERLFLETDGGQVIPCEKMSHELLAFLVRKK